MVAETSQHKSKKITDPENSVHFYLWIPKNLAEQSSEEAAGLGITRSAYLRLVLVKHFERGEKLI